MEEPHPIWLYPPVVRVGGLQPRHSQLPRHRCRAEVMANPPVKFLARNNHAHTGGEEHDLILFRCDIYNAREGATVPRPAAPHIPPAVRRAG